MLLSIKQFSEKYETSIQGIDSYISQNKDSILSKSIVKNNKGHRYVNEDALKRRAVFVKKVWIESHDNYFEISEHLSDYKFSKLISSFLGGSRESWNEFLSHGLFMMSAGSKPITNQIVNEKLWAFWRFSNFLIKKSVRMQEKREAAIYARLPNRDKYGEIYKERIPPEGRRLNYLEC